MFTLTITAYNLVRLPKLIAVVAQPRPDSAQKQIFAREIGSQTRPVRFCYNPAERLYR
jgi:hypothetical protein